MHRASMFLLAVFAMSLLVDGSVEAADLTVRQVTEALVKARAGQPPDFSRKDLSFLDLSNLDFKQATLTGANLAGADLTEADLDGSVLKEAKNIDQAKHLDTVRHRDRAIY
jgi:uncharacterized protein YjbI with pentapeptide repeats